MLNKINACKPNKTRNTPKRLNSARTSPLCPFLSKYKYLSFLCFFSFVFPSLIEKLRFRSPLPTQNSAIRIFYGVAVFFFSSGGENGKRPYPADKHEKDQYHFTGNTELRR